MPKVSKSGARGSFYCPGCQVFHSFVITTDNYNGDGGNPTVSPRLVYADGGTVVCVSNITSGNITYSPDSRHPLAGQTVSLPNVINGVPQ